MKPDHFVNCTEALRWFCQSLEARGRPVLRKEKVPAHAGHGRVLMQDVVYTETGDVYYMICRPRGRWYPKPSAQVSDFGKDLDDRLKFAIRTFGKGDGSLSGLNEDSLLWLLEKEDHGWQTYLVTLFPQTAEVLWCSAREAYDFVMRYGILPQHSRKGLDGQTMVSIPTGWMQPWVEPVIAYPNVVS